ncbi:hypothetical protein GGI18_000419 [Coemansia linderi]|uniref:Uncharacterized protein n=1 Tax=Coemansia linderi TaxID=2663919 RepID=A0ACC1KMX5_9FUNG|nr:hypothetical protein GGI18_000419 [Coemansia linderi]
MDILEATLTVFRDPNFYGDGDYGYDSISHITGVIIALMALGCAIFLIGIISLSWCIARKIRRGKNKHTPTYGPYWVVTQPTNVAYVYPQIGPAFMPPQATPAFMPPQITAIDMPRATTTEQLQTTADEPLQTTAGEQSQTATIEQPRTINPTA